MKVVFVCTGNTCRSPMAEAIFKSILKERGIQGVSVSSYGLAVNPFEAVTEQKAVDAVKALGIPMRVKKSKQISSKIAGNADLVVAMTNRHKASLPYPNAYTLDELTSSGEIPDPYGGTQEVYNATAFTLKLALTNLAAKIIER